jgi:hypothetical protein
MKKHIDVATFSSVVGTLYPEPFDLPCRARERTKLGDAAGLTQFGVNLCRHARSWWNSFGRSLIAARAGCGCSLLAAPRIITLEIS